MKFIKNGESTAETLKTICGEMVNCELGSDKYINGEMAFTSDNARKCDINGTIYTMEHCSGVIYVPTTWSRDEMKDFAKSLFETLEAEFADDAIIRKRVTSSSVHTTNLTESGIKRVFFVADGDKTDMNNPKCNFVWTIRPFDNMMAIEQTIDNVIEAFACIVFDKYDVFNAEHNDTIVEPKHDDLRVMTRIKCMQKTHITHFKHTDYIYPFMYRHSTIELVNMPESAKFKDIQFPTTCIINHKSKKAASVLEDASGDTTVQNNPIIKDVEYAGADAAIPQCRLKTRGKYTGECRSASQCVGTCPRPSYTGIRYLKKMGRYHEPTKRNGKGAGKDDGKDAIENGKDEDLSDDSDSVDSMDNTAEVEDIDMSKYRDTIWFCDTCEKAVFGKVYLYKLKTNYVICCPECAHSNDMHIKTKYISTVPTEMRHVMEKLKISSEQMDIYSACINGIKKMDKPEFMPNGTTCYQIGDEYIGVSVGAFYKFIFSSDALELSKLGKIFDARIIVVK